VKEIIILGGGFSGVSAALRLRERLTHQEANITLIDKNSYHLFTPSIYELATSEEPQKNVAIPYFQIFEQRVKVIKGEVSDIDTSNHLVNLKDETHYAYDYLIIALGSEPAYYGVEGLEKYAVALKNLEDAVLIRKQIEETYHKKVYEGKKMEILIGGGGFTGTEFAAELVKFREKLAKHHKKEIDLVGIRVIQGSASLLKELDDRVSQLAQKRLMQGGVNVVLSSHIKKVDEKIVETDDGNKFNYDVLVWTGGVKANSVLERSGLKTNGRGQVTVDDKMQINGFTNLYAVGDVAEFAEPVTNKPAPNVAEIAEDEGKVAAENIFRSIRGADLVSYEYKHLGYIVPLTGKFAVAELPGFRIVGFFGWVLQQLVFLYYLMRILPYQKAIKRWNKFEMYLMNNS
jgi:NADH dehydrogenase